MNSSDPSHIIAIGASAGGLESIEAFFSNMPEDNPFGFVVIQHLSPDYKSLMKEILSKQTMMPIHNIEHGMKVEKGNIYLIPPRKALEIFNGELLLTDLEITAGLKLPIDIFLKSLAEDQKEKAIAIIFSGTGSDGMRGVGTIKDHGGMIMVQNEEGAQFNGMPRAAISTGITDFILPPDQMPAQIFDYVNHPLQKDLDFVKKLDLESDDLTRIFSMLRSSFRVDFSEYKMTTVSRRLERRMIARKAENLNEYVQLLTQSPTELPILFRELLIGVTSFFRDSEVWEQLENDIVPNIISGGVKQEFRCWVAGCSTGEEAYTLAMVITSVLETLNRNIAVKIFATDINKDSLAFASTGTYPGSVAADIPDHFLTRYMVPGTDHLTVTRAIREKVVFAEHNLVKDPPFTNIDLVLCRNMLIYVNPGAQRKVMDYFLFSIRNRGYMVLGKNESAGDLRNQLEIISQPSKIFRAITDGEKVLSVQSPPVLSMAKYQPRSSMESRSAGYNTQGYVEKILEQIFKAAGSKLLPVTVIVNEQQEILHIIGDMRPFLQITTGKPIYRLDKMVVHKLSIPLSTGIPKALSSGKDILYTGLTFSEENTIYQVDLRILPIQLRNSQGSLAVVQFILNSQGNADSDESVEKFELSAEADQRIQDLEQELQLSRENLQAAVEELETANEELQATNEELLASNEELQSTNEELQSTNEELYTVNADYHTKIIELTNTQNDLDNLFTSIQTSTLLLDENLEIRRFSRDISKILRVMDSDVGRPIAYISHDFPDFDLMGQIEKTNRDSKVWEGWQRTRSGNLYNIRIAPYLINRSINAGVVATFTISNHLSIMESRLNTSLHILRSMGSLEVGGFEWNLVEEQVYLTPELLTLFGISGEELPPDELKNLEGLFSFFSAPFRQEAARAFNLCRQEGAPVDISGLMIRKDGKQRPIQLKADPVYIESNLISITGFVIATDRKQPGETENDG